jgi:hypothetical protein
VSGEEDEGLPNPDATAAAVDESAGGDDEGPGTHRAEAKHHTDHTARDADGNAPAAPQPPDAPAVELDVALRRAGLLAAARAKAAAGAADAAGSRGGAGLESIADGRADGKAAQGLALAARDAQALGAGSADVAGLQAVLGATPANLVANADSAQFGAAAGAADFSLASLGPAGGAPGAPAAPAEPAPAQATLAPPPGSAAFPAALARN